jgi:hypothetical protein
MHRARAALKKALVGEADTAGLSLSQILSVAARKAAHDAKNVGVQAMSILAIAVLGVAAFLNFGSFAPATQVADAPEVQTALPQAPTESQTQLPAPEQSSATNEPEQTAELPVEEQPVAAEPEPLAETVAVVEPEPALPEESSSDSTGATSAAVLLTDPSIDRSPFDPWLVDSLIGGFSSSSMLEPESLGDGQSQWVTVISDSGVWLDANFNANSRNPISNVKLGFVVDGKQFSASPSRIDFVVQPGADGLDHYLFQGRIGDIADSSGNLFSDSRMKGVFVNIVVKANPLTGQVEAMRLDVGNPS